MLNISEKNHLLLRTIDEIIINTFGSTDIAQSGKKMLEAVGKAFNCDRCYIRLFNDFEKKFSKIDKSSEYLKSSKVKSLSDYDFSLEFYEMINQFKKKSLLDHAEGIICLPNWQEQSLQFSEKYMDLIKILSEEFCIKSVYKSIIKNGSEVLGIFVINFTEDFVNLDAEEIKVLEIISLKIAYILKQAQLVEINKKRAERESLIRDLIKKISDTKDIDEIKNHVVKNIGKSLNAARCFINEYDFENNESLPISNEYLSSPEINSVKGKVRKNRLANEALNKELIIYDYQKYLKENKPDNNSKEIYDLSNHKISSGFSVPIYYKDKCFGAIIIQFNKVHSFKNEDVDFARTVANHVGIAINQCNLYKSLERKIEIEKLLTNLITTVRSTIELDQMLTIICDKIGKAFDVDKTSIIQFIDPEDYSKWHIKREYVAFENIKTIRESNQDKDIGLFWGDIFFNQDKSFYYIENVQRAGLPEPLNSCYLELEFKTVLGIRIKKDNDNWGGLYLSSVRNFKKWTKEEIKLLEVISDHIYTAIKQAKLYQITKKQVEKETLLRKITQTIRSSLDINKTLKIICEEVAKLFEVEKVLIIQNSRDKNKIPILRVQFITDNSIAPHDLSGLNKPIHAYWRKMTYEDKGIIAIDNVAESNFPDALKKMYKQLGTKSLLGVSISGENNKWGLINLHKVNGSRHWTEEEIDLLQSISHQIYFAIKQADLHEKAKQTAERESLLRKITGTIRSTLDISEIKNRIVTETGKLLEAQRCFIYEFSPESKQVYIDAYSEYLASPEVRSTANEPIREIASEWSYINVIEKRELYIPDTQKYIEEGNKYGTNIEKYILDYDIKSDVGMPILYGDKIQGNLVIHFDKKNPISTEELNLIRSIADQAGIAFYQAKLYESIKKNAEQEALLRKTVETIRSTLDINEIKKILVTEIGKTLNVDRVLLVEFDPEINKFAVLDKYSEYLSSSDLISCVGFDFSSPKVDFLANIHKQTKSAVISDFEEFITEHNLQNTPEAEWLAETELKSGIGITIFHGKKIYGVLSIHYTKNKVSISDEQIKFLETIGAQIGIAIYQARLYKTVQETAKREKLLREIVLSLVSSVSSLNINDVFKSIVTETGKLFKADRCFFVEYDLNKNEVLPQENYKEYLASKKIKPGYNRVSTKAELAELLEIVINKKQILKVENVDKATFPEETKAMLKDLSIKSFIAFPIIYGDAPLGILVLHYIKDYMQFNQSEIDALNVIATQSGIIINQAKLYKKIQQTAKKEKILAEIITIIKSNLKINEVFLIISSLLKQFYDVDKVHIAKLNPREKSLNILNECCKNNETDDNGILSLKSKNYFYEQIVKNRKVIINDIKNADNPIYLIKDLKSANIKSFIMVPIIINAIEAGAIILHDNKKCNFGEEDISFLSSVSDYIAIAIKDSNLYSQAEFVSNVSHELKTPLSIINGYTRTLLGCQDLDHDSIYKFLNVIKNNSERLNKLIDNLLFISTIEEKVQLKNIAFEKLKVTDLIENSIQFCNEKIGLKNIKLEKNIENLVIEKANTLLLQQLIINLITNAVNYSELYSKIRINAFKKDKEILISIEDEGCGIKKEDISNIFERFYRVDKSRDRETGGVGLGLSISKLISEIHGGYISVESVFGEGSIFTLHLPG